MVVGIWQLRQVTLRGDAANRLDNVTLDIQPGVTAIVGHSGAGKTSLLNVLVAMEKPASGTVDFQQGKPDTPEQRAFSVPLFWAPQDAGLWPHLSAIEHLRAVFDSNSRKSGDATRESAHCLDNLLVSFDLNHRRLAFPGELSPGEQSRLSVARLLAANPAVLVMDEPLAHVDLIRRPNYWKIIREHLQTTNASLLFSTHEPDVAVREAEFVICMQEGRVVYNGGTKELYHNPSHKAAAEFLGPINWFAADELSAWFTDGTSTNGHRAFRPERLLLEPDESANTQVLSFQFSGSYAETTLKHLPTSIERTIIHRPPGHIYSVGQSVRIKVLS